MASIGIDLALGAIAFGASQVAVLATRAEAESYGAALREQMGYAEEILRALGYKGVHVTLVEGSTAAALEAELWRMAPAQTVAKAATYNLAAEKRTSLDFAIDHLARQAPKPQTAVEFAIWLLCRTAEVLINPQTDRA